MTMTASSPSSGCLYLVATPIGNLKDITFRAVEVLKSCHLILAEDTRTTGILTSHYQIDTPRHPFHLHNEHRSVNRYIEMLGCGKHIALVSDAGTPGIADVGYLLVREALAVGVGVVALPGPVALIPALVISGLPCDRFYFEGFLPHKKGRQTRLRYLSTLEETVVLYESPHRIGKLLSELIAHCGAERPASLSREISKKFEETLRGTLGEISEEIEKRKGLKGEMVICLGGVGRKNVLRN